MKSFLKNIVVILLTLEARMLLQRKKPRIVAITGSVGKTSTKDAIYAVVKQSVYARKSEKSFNSELGVPLSILGLPNAWNSPLGWTKNLIDGFFAALFPGEYPEWLILEVGVDRPGDMAHLTRWMKPDVVVLTRLPTTPVHVEFFDSPEDVTREKVKLVEALKPDGVLVYNHDDEKVLEVAEGIVQKSIGYSRYSMSAFTASADTIMYENGIPVGIECTLTHEDTATVVRIKGSLGVQHAYNYAAAAAVGSVLGVGINEAADALREHIPPPGRMRLLPGLKNTIIIDDTYNSSPVALERSLQALKEVHARRKIAVLGDMLELGKYSVREHKEAGTQVAESADILLTVGIRARGIAEGALQKGMSEKNIFQYEESDRAGNELQNMIQDGDVILIKGSQSVRMERIVKEIMAYPEEAQKLLVRQSPAWRD